MAGRFGGSLLSISPNKLFALGSWLAVLAAAVSLGWSGLEVYRRHLSPAPVQEFSFPSAHDRSSQGITALDSVIRAHIFGVVPAIPKPGAEETKIVEPPKTRLSLILTGVIAFPLEGDGIAMIEIRRGETSVVQVGDKLGDTGASLRGVFDDHVLVQHGDKLEKLLLERDLLATMGNDQRLDSAVGAMMASHAMMPATVSNAPQRDSQIADGASGLTDPTSVADDMAIKVASNLESDIPMFNDIGQVIWSQQSVPDSPERSSTQSSERSSRNSAESRVELANQQREVGRLQALQQRFDEESQHRMDSAGRVIKQIVPGGLKEI